MSRVERLTHGLAAFSASDGFYERPAVVSAVLGAFLCSCADTTASESDVVTSLAQAASSIVQW